MTGDLLLSLRLLLPEILLTLLICGILLYDSFLPLKKKERIGTISLLGTVVVLLSLLPLWGMKQEGFFRLFMVDTFAVLFKILFLIATALTILISRRYLTVVRISVGEYYALILSSTLGMMVLASGNDFITIFTGYELMSLPLYILAGFLRGDPRSGEASLKYFILGAFSSGILLYGMALFYGLTGTTLLPEIRTIVSSLSVSPALVLAVILLAVGFGFKLSLVPFHMWAPDVYEGAPTPVVAYMSVGAKAAAFAVLVRIFFATIGSLSSQWEPLLWWLSVLTMTLGNLTAIVQENVKRLLAYSSISQAGYILIGVIASKTEYGLAAVVLYTFVYILMNIGAFSLIIFLCTGEKKGEMISEFSGLARTHPYAAAALMIFFLSLIGIPPTGGFVGKFLLFSAAIEAKFIWLAIIGVLNSVISLFYYFRIVKEMYMREPQERQIVLFPSLVFAISLMSVALLVIGAYPAPFIEAARAAAAAIHY